jgi:hypothetical protein
MSDLNFGYDQAEQMDNMRERLEAEAEKEEELKESLTDDSMDKLQKYYEENCDCMVDDPDVMEGRFMRWFEDETYHDLLAILNK